VRVDPGALDPEAASKLSGIDKLVLLHALPFENLDNAARNCLDCLPIEFDARGFHPAPVVHGAAQMHRLDPREGGSQCVVQ